MSKNLLQQIQTLQFTDKAQAEALLKGFIHDMFALDIASVELRPLAVSLNSFNGFVQLTSGRRLFFKTHTEPDNVIGEYYHATLLSEVGYPVIQPVYSSTEADKQLLIYEVIDDPSVFDAAWAIENGDDTPLAALTQAQHEADKHLFELYLASLHQQTAEEAAQAAVHQLFYHRLTGGRLARFYDNTRVHLPAGDFPMSQVRQMHWRINGQRYTVSLDDLIAQAIRILHPAQAGPAIIGHGDAHNGNVFFDAEAAKLTYFDPAFAGKHHPLLDLTKPLFHNVFAMWMYFPAEKKAQTPIEMIQSGDNQWIVNYDYPLHPVREMFLGSKVQHTLIPILKHMKAQGILRSDWRAFLKVALFCCPFLTMNLADQSKFSPEISLLGLAMAVEMGAESSDTLSRIDVLLNAVEQQLD